MKRAFQIMVLATATAQLACAPILSSDQTVCETGSECPDGFHCDRRRGLCVTNSDPVDAAVADAAVADVVVADAVVADADSRDAAGSDGASRDTAASDLAAPDVAVPDVASADTAVPDAAAPDAAAPDAARPDQGSVDACVQYAGQPCDLPGLCGATYNCAGDCVGGSVAPDCPQCGTRSCVDGRYWGDCEDGDCGTYAYCDTEGRCQCTSSQCEDTQCYDGDLYSCDLDPYGCGWLVLLQDCWDNDCGGDPPGCGGGSPCGWLECTNSDGICVPGRSVIQCGSWGEPCDKCTSSRICETGSCIDGDCYYLPTSGEPCGDNRVCFNGECCVFGAGEACAYLCPPCYCSTPGWTACDGSCVPYNCFDVCASC